MVKGLAKSETTCTMIVLIKCVDASTFDLSKAGYSPVTAGFYLRSHLVFKKINVRRRTPTIHSRIEVLWVTFCTGDAMWTGSLTCPLTWQTAHCFFIPVIISAPDFSMALNFTLSPTRNVANIDFSLTSNVMVMADMWRFLISPCLMVTWPSSLYRVRISPSVYSVAAVALACSLGCAMPSMPAAMETLAAARLMASVAILKVFMMFFLDGLVDCIDR